MILEANSQKEEYELQNAIKRFNNQKIKKIIE
jgi:hypothetical protein